MLNKLFKPFPFCGADPDVMSHDQYLRNILEDNAFIVRCKDCGKPLISPDIPKGTQDIKAMIESREIWNRRA